MPNGLSTIEGAKDVQRFLKEAPALAVANGLLDALQAAAKPIELELAVRTPIGPDEAKSEDKLVESQVTEYRIDPQLRGGSLEVGFGKQSHKANWVEFGHRVVAKGTYGREYYVDARGKTRRRKVSTGAFVPAHPFIRPAFAASEDAAVEAFEKSITETIANFLDAE